MTPTWTATLALLLTALAGAFPARAAADDSSTQVEPGAMVLLDSGKSLAVALRRSGEVVLLDVQSGQIRKRLDLGNQLTGLAELPRRRKVLVAMTGPNRLAMLNTDRELSLDFEFALERPPGFVAVSPEGSSVAVGFPDARTVSIYGIEADRLKVGAPISLDFVPGRLAFSPDGSHLLVADAFGGRIGIVDPVTEKISAHGQFGFPFHNISGMTFSAGGDKLLVSHQRLSSLARTSFDDLHWGTLIRNEISVLSWPFESRSDGKGQRPAETLSVGDVHAGGGDPAGIAVDSQGRTFVALSGTNEFGVIASGSRELTQRLAVGSSPRNLLLDEQNARLFVANALSNSVTVINTETLTVVATHSLVSTHAQLTARDRGELLFFSAQLSHDRWMSCHSCHTGGKSNGLLIDTFGDSSFGTAKRVPSLMGVADTAPYGWDGSKADLVAQIESTMATTMHPANSLSAGQLEDLVIFLESLDAPPAPAREDRASLDRGRELFAGQLDCARCHDPAAAYTSAEIYDVGLQDEMGATEFNPPSLRGLASRSSFFHDGRADSLEGVFSKVSHQLNDHELTAQELADLLAFLRSL